MQFTEKQLTEIIAAANEVITALADENEDLSKSNTVGMIRAYDYLNDDAAPPEVVKRLAEIALAALQQEPETNDRQTLRRLAVILAGNNSPGEIMALTVTAQSFVDRCNQLVAERNAFLAGATRQTQRTNRTEE